MTKTTARSAPDPTLRRRADDWATEVAAWKKSGQTAEAYARGRQMRRLVLACSHGARELALPCPQDTAECGGQVFRRDRHRAVGRDLGL